MFRRKAAVGVCALCALALSSVAAQGVTAATNGTTGFTCKEKKEPGGAGFSDAHCKLAVGTGAQYEHVAIPEGVTTEGRLTNITTGSERSTAVLVSTQSGVEEELRANQVVGEASGKNTKTAAGEHFSEGTGNSIYKEVEVTKPAGKGCKVKGGEIVSKALKGTSLGAGMGGKLEPAAGSTFAEFEIEGCTVAALNGLYKVEGSIQAAGEGSTAVYTTSGVTTQGTFKLRGQKAGLGVSTTATGRANSSEPFTPLAVTTVPTP